jgi:hypothetical protein
VSQPPDDTLIYPVALELAACLCEIAFPTGDPCFCGLWPHTRPPYEYAAMCDTDDCGVGYVQLDQGFPSSAIPAVDALGRCNTPLGFRFTVGVLRCYPITGDENSPEPPDGTQLAEWARWQYADMAAIRKAIKCCLDTKFEDLDYVLGSFTPVTPISGVAGGAWQVTIGQR